MKKIKKYYNNNDPPQSSITINIPNNLLKFKDLFFKNINKYLIENDEEKRNLIYQSIINIILKYIKFSTQKKHTNITKLLNIINILIFYCLFGINIYQNNVKKLEILNDFFNLFVKIIIFINNEFNLKEEDLKKKNKIYERIKLIFLYKENIINNIIDGEEIINNNEKINNIFKNLQNKIKLLFI